MTNFSPVGPPAARPCGGCPYRRDVPSGIWTKAEYDKLREYDAETPFQPPKIFRCHLEEKTSTRAKVCGGWAGCPSGKRMGHELFGPRIAVAEGRISPETLRAIMEYVSPVPLFNSGNEAADHGMRDIDNPGPDAHALMDKIEKSRSDLVHLDDKA